MPGSDLWTVSTAHPEALGFVRSLSFDPPTAAFDAAFGSDRGEDER